jgi:rhomboid-like protein
VEPETNPSDGNSEAPRPRFPVLVTIIAINVGVFLLWRLAAARPPLERWLEANFLVSLAHLRDGRPWTLFTAVFSHAELFHLALNMMALGSFGRLFEQALGGKRFLVFYLVGALVSSLTHCALSLAGWPDVPALGASGAVSAVVILFALIFPGHKIYLFGFVPLPAWLATGLFVAWDLWGVVAQRDGGGLPIGHGAHLGGALWGAAFYFFSVRPRLRRVAPPPA